MIHPKLLPEPTTALSGLLTSKRYRTFRLGQIALEALCIDSLGMLVRLNLSAEPYPYPPRIRRIPASLTGLPYKKSAGNLHDSRLRISLLNVIKHSTGLRIIFFTVESFSKSEKSQEK